MSVAAFRFETGTATHTGRVRQVNEDGLFAEPEWGVWLVADGMGGHENGQLASATIVKEASTIGNAVSAPDLLARFRDRIFRANASLLQAADRQGPHVIIGSTVAAVLVYGGHYACVWSGDSRIYLVRGGHIRQLSRDHTHVQDLVDSGIITRAEARASPQRSLITRAVGIAEDPGLEVVEGEIEAGDAFVICSDGLTDTVEHVEIRRHVESHAPQAACDALIGLALQRGAQDNVTVVVVRCQAGDAG